MILNNAKEKKSQKKNRKSKSKKNKSKSKIGGSRKTVAAGLAATVLAAYLGKKINNNRTVLSSLLTRGEVIVTLPNEPSYEYGAFFDRSLFEKIEEPEFETKFISYKGNKNLAVNPGGNTLIMHILEIFPRSEKKEILLTGLEGILNFSKVDYLRLGHLNLEKESILDLLDKIFDPEKKKKIEKLLKDYDNEMEKIRGYKLTGAIPYKKFTHPWVADAVAERINRVLPIPNIVSGDIIQISDINKITFNYFRDTQQDTMREFISKDAKGIIYVMESKIINTDTLYQIKFMAINQESKESKEGIFNALQLEDFGQLISIFELPVSTALVTSSSSLENPRTQYIQTPLLADKPHNNTKQLDDEARQIQQYGDVFHDARDEQPTEE